MKYEQETKEPECKTIEHYKKINILGCRGVGKSSLISLMEHYEDDKFEINNEIENDELENDEKYFHTAETKKKKYQSMIKIIYI